MTARILPFPIANSARAPAVRPTRRLTDREMASIMGPNLADARPRPGLNARRSASLTRILVGFVVLLAVLFLATVLWAHVQNVVETMLQQASDMRGM
ncbi:hypothetical protein D1122_01495 [Cereibacter sphaeroides]|uniref:hypothetical protein n=1 Tax=Cereibacter sphaeroides TaxID=1063 RepID=UPI000E5BA6F3|nr:hypothetical protein [Cereibacter sphaeroides]RIA01363.1 hypothetical protein D1122_01495 [Cereibacter sphaeroides]